MITDRGRLSSRSALRSPPPPPGQRLGRLQRGHAPEHEPLVEVPAGGSERDLGRMTNPASTIAARRGGHRGAPPSRRPAPARDLALDLDDCLVGQLTCRAERGHDRRNSCGEAIRDRRLALAVRVRAKLDCEGRPLEPASKLVVVDTPVISRRSSTPKSCASSRQRRSSASEAVGPTTASLAAGCAEARCPNASTTLAVCLTSATTPRLTMSGALSSGCARGVAAGSGNRNSIRSIFPRHLAPHRAALPAPHSRSGRGSGRRA